MAAAVEPQNPSDSSLVRFLCPHCSQSYEAEASSRGESFVCQICGTTMTVPRLPPRPPASRNLSSSAGETGWGPFFLFVFVVAALGTGAYFASKYRDSCVGSDSHQAGFFLMDDDGIRYRVSAKSATPCENAVQQNLSGRAGLDETGCVFSGTLYNGNAGILLSSVTVNIETYEEESGDKSKKQRKRTTPYAVDVIVPPFSARDFKINVLWAGKYKGWSIESAKQFEMIPSTKGGFDLSDSSLSKLHGRAGFTDKTWRTFEGTVYNGNPDIRLTEMRIELKTEETSDSESAPTIHTFVYSTPVDIPPLSSGTFSVRTVWEGQYKSWNIVGGTGRLR